jgi:NhaA family Na+:H+ antiporter
MSYFRTYVVRPFQAFMHLEAASGMVMILAAIIALSWANSPWSSAYSHLWEITIPVQIGAFSLHKSLHFWVNDGLMVIFFFLIGLEIKREILIGELSSVKKSIFPILGAVGGMLTPALIYAGLNWRDPAIAGWGIPMATDIAFALGILAMFGKRIPAALKIFLAALAIADDLGAILVIAIFYTAHISWLLLLVAVLGLGVLALCNRLGIRHPAVYAILGIIGVWVPFLFSGIHPTVAGVLVAFTVPLGQIAKTRLSKQTITDHAFSTLRYFEHHLHGVVGFLILPIFALANAGVTYHGLTALVSSHLGLGIILGLLFGKPLGIVLLTWLGVTFKIASLPKDCQWSHILGVGFLAGIGFTMSIFIAELAFGGTDMLAISKISILIASLLSGIVGSILLWQTRPIAKSKERAS